MAANLRGYDHHFVKPPPDDLLCLICLCVARDPQRINCCGKVLCNGCLKEFKKHSNRCPQCRKDIVSYADKTSQRHILSLKTRCDNSSNGCEWVGELCYLEKHLASCGFTLLPCPNECRGHRGGTKCKVVQLLRKDLEKHLKEECPQRQYKCPHCQEVGDYQERTTKHLHECPMIEVPCPKRSCKVHVARHNLVKHRQECLFEKVPCKYSNIGCEEVVLRKDLEEHEKNAQQHLQMTIDTVHQIQITMKKTLAHISSQQASTSKDIHNKKDIESDQNLDIKGLHLTSSFSEATNRARVPFLDHKLLECDCNGREYTNVDHDITLRIPEGAVAEGKKVHFEVGVAMYGPFIFPENTQPISPILWLCLHGEDIELKKPFQVVLPHYLTGLSKERIEYHQIGFAKANHKEYTFVDSQMTYRVQRHITESQVLHASSGCKSYGVLVSKHCCFYCLLANKSHELAMDAGYCLVRVESSLPPLRNDIYFSAIYFLDTCLRSLEEQFPSDEGYRFTRYHDFKFCDSRAELEIKVEVSSEHKDHCVIAMEPLNAKIKATDINFWTIARQLDDMQLRHQRKMYPPRVKMTVTMKNRDSILKLPVKFLGCSSDSNLDMELTLPIGSPLLSPSSSVSSGSTMDAQSHNITCEKPKLSKTFRKLLPISNKWRNIGTLLDLPSGKLEGIAADESDMDSRLRAMLDEWLKQVNPPPTWIQLADAVEPFDKAKAQELRKSCIDLPECY